MARTISRPFTEQDRDERANLLAVTGRVPKAAAIEHLNTVDGGRSIDTEIAAALHGHDGLGPSDCYLLDQMACCTSTNDDAEPAPGLTPWEAFRSFCAGFLAFLKAPKPDFSRRRPD